MRRHVTIHYMPGNQESGRRRKPEGNRNHPRWAERERSGDMSWIQEILHVLAPAAREQYQQLGRGAVVIDMTVQPHPSTGYPIWYLPTQQLKSLDESDVKRMVGAYDPEHEMVLVLLKPWGRQSAYQLRLIPPGPTDPR